MGNFMQWWSDLRTAHKEKKAIARRKTLERMSCETINVTEFDGKLYLSHNDTPIVPVANLNTDVEKVLAISRQGYLAWREKFATHG